MTVSVKHLLEQTATQLQDQNHERWPLSELLDYLNAGMREIIWLQPLAFRQWRILSLQQGPRQVFTDAFQILDLTGNIQSGDYNTGVVRGRALRRVSLDRLDLFSPNWLDSQAAVQAKEYALDTVDRQSFWVFPPNDGTGMIEARIIAKPQFLDEPANPDDPASYDTMEANIEAEYAPALVYYMLSRAWAKDADFAGNMEISTRYYGLFKSMLASGSTAGGDGGDS